MKGIILFVTTLFLLVTYESYGTQASGGSAYHPPRQEVHTQGQPGSEELKELIEAYNPGNLYFFSKMIFLNEPQGKSYEQPNQPLSYELIYNLKGYDEFKWNEKERVGEVLKRNLPIFHGDNPYHEGSPLSLPDGTPIGYTIYLPKGKEVKAVMVVVYGGSEKRLIKEKLYYPFPPNGLSDALLREGIAVIELNLVDLLELEGAQYLMLEGLHTRLHGSINKFYEVLKNQPEKIHKDLSSLKGKKIFLYGASFGGRTTIRQAELFPDTFSGYISHNGALSYEKLYENVRILPADYFLISSDVKNTAQWLSPMSDYRKVSDLKGDDKIKRIEKPVLLLHSLDDNRVGVEVTLHWYEAALQNSKGSLTRLPITKMGNPVSEERGTKGHFLPADQKAFEDYVYTITSFMLKGPSSLPALSEWRSKKSESLANEFAGGTTVEEKFLSLAYQLYKKASQEKGEAAEIRKKEQQNRIWKAKYVPILYSLSHAQELKEKPEKITPYREYLNKSGILSAQVLENALKEHLPQFIQFLKEMKILKIAPEVSMDSLFKDKTLQSKLKELLTGSLESKMIHGFAQFYLEAIDLRTYLLLKLYQGNLDLISKGLIEPAAYQAVVAKWDEKKLDALKTKFLETLDKESGLVKKTWQQVKKAAVQQSRQAQPRTMAPAHPDEARNQG